MLIQTAEHRHYRELPEKQWWPYNPVDLWWRAAKRAPDPELLALRMLERWRDHATWELLGSLFGPEQNKFLEVTGANRFARMSDRISVSPVALLSVFRKLRANYTGKAITMDRSSDSTTQDIYYIGDTIDVPSMLSFVGANTGYVNKVFDQSTNAYDYTKPGSSQHPRIINSGTLDTSDANAAPTMVFDGTDDCLTRGDTLGLSGSPALNLCFVAKVGVTGGYFVQIGTGTTGNHYRATPAANSGRILLESNAANRIMSNNVDSLAAHRYYICGAAASATVGQWTARQNAVDLSQFSVTNGSQTLSISGSVSSWGCMENTAPTPANFFNGKGNFYAVYSAVLSGNDQAMVEQEMLLHC